MAFVGETPAALDLVEGAVTALARVVDAEPKTSIVSASDALDNTDGDMHLATELLAEQVLAQPKLVKEMLPAWAKAWAFGQVATEVSNRRRAIARANGPKVDGSTFRAAVEANHSRLMEMPIFGGKPIGGATPTEVFASAERYESLAKDSGHKARWQRAVAEAAGNAETIAQALSEARLAVLWEEARGN